MYFNGSQWIALGTASGGLFVGSNEVVMYANTGNTIGSSMTPLVIGTFTPTIATLNNLTLNGITGSTQCLQVNSSGVVSGSGSGCGGSGSVTSITGTTNEVIASASTGAVTLSLPQAICTTCGVEFGSIEIQGNHYPSTDNAYDNGTSSFGWAGVYAHSYAIGSTTVIDGSRNAIFANVTISPGGSAVTTDTGTGFQAYNTGSTASTALLGQGIFAFNGSTTEFSVDDTIGNVFLNGTLTMASESSHSGQATCFKTSGVIGYCSTVVGATGACTCN